MSNGAKLTVIAVVALLLLLLLTDPRQLPSVALMAPFVFLFGIVSLTAASLLRDRMRGRSRRLRMAAAIGAFPVLLLVLQSLGQLTIRDSLAIIALFIIAYFYISKFGIQTSG